MRYSGVNIRLGLPPHNQHDRLDFQRRRMNAQSGNRYSMLGANLHPELRHRLASFCSSRIEAGWWQLPDLISAVAMIANGLFPTLMLHFNCSGSGIVEWPEEAYDGLRMERSEEPSSLCCQNHLRLWCRSGNRRHTYMDGCGSDDPLGRTARANHKTAFHDQLCRRLRKPKHMDRGHPATHDLV